MEVQILRKELVKPSSSSIYHKKPYKITLLDQLTPATYIPVVFFYPIKNNITTNQQFLAPLKKSLSETLNLYYPFSGRPTSDNLYINRFDEGVPFFEAIVNCSMSDFLKLHQTDLLNRFLPCKPFSKEELTDIPLLASQVTIFSCGGISLGCSMSHKLIDGTTAASFISTWTSLCRGDHNGVITPDLHQPSQFFPSINSIPRTHLSLMDNLWFNEDNYVTKKFYFSPKAISTLKARATNGNNGAYSSRIETLSCFVWKYCMEATSMVERKPRPSILVEAVNLRPRTKPRMNKGSIGNLFWWAIAVGNPNNTELHGLTSLVREAIGIYKTEYTHSLQGENGFESMSKQLEQLNALFSLEKPEVFRFTSWCNMGFTRPNFGWGEPFWVGIMGKAGPGFRNLTVFLDAMDGEGIECWITLDDKRMESLQRIPKFLEFANPNLRSLY